MKTAMILAAGRGERLRPFTDHTPKPLYPIEGVPVIEHHVSRLAQAGFRNIIINHAWLGDCIRRHLGHGQKWDVSIQYSPEPPGGLETGGGIYQALSLLGEQPFLTINADIVTDFPLNTLKLPAHSLAHLVLIPNISFFSKSDFSLNPQTGLVRNAPRDSVFSGIACYHPAFFSKNKPGRYSVAPILREASEQELVTGEIYWGAWQDIGTLISAEKAVG